MKFDLPTRRVTTRPGNSGIVPEIKALSGIPESIPNVPEIVYFFWNVFFLFAQLFLKLNINVLHIIVLTT
jgi:hypothetical protein